MSNFWIKELKPGYYDLILEEGLRKQASIQANWHNITFLKISQFLKINMIHLDYACGPGTLRGKYSRAKSTGVDISDNQISYAKNKYGSEKFLFNKDFDITKYEEKFDVITIIGLFEFLTNDEILDLLKNLKKILKPGGRILSTTLNFKSYLRVLLYFQYTFGKINYKSQHINHFSQKKMESLLSKSDFENYNIEKFMNMGVMLSCISNDLGIKVHKFIESVFNKNLGALIFVEFKK